MLTFFISILLMHYLNFNNGDSKVEDLNINKVYSK